MKRTCRKCHGTFSESLFHRDRSRADGLRTRCKGCDTASCRSWRHKNAERVRSYKRARYAENPQAVSVANSRARKANPAMWMISSARNRARLKGLEFDLDDYREEIRTRANAMTCELTGVPLDSSAAKAWNSPSLDRIDPSRGYTYSNIRIVAYAMNCALGTWGESKLRALMMAWAAR